MAVQSTHLSASIRLLDSERKGLGTLGRVRPDLTRENVAALIEGVNGIRVGQATNAALTIQTELSEADGQ